MPGPGDRRGKKDLLIRRPTSGAYEMVPSGPCTSGFGVSIAFYRPNSHFFSPYHRNSRYTPLFQETERFPREKNWRILFHFGRRKNKVVPQRSGDRQDEAAGVLASLTGSVRGGPDTCLIQNPSGSFFVRPKGPIRAWSGARSLYDVKTAGIDHLRSV